jgi:hypothetical protein
MKKKTYYSAFKGLLTEFCSEITMHKKIYSLIQYPVADVQLSNVYEQIWETKSKLTHLFCLYFDDVTSGSCY